MIKVIKIIVIILIAALVIIGASVVFVQAGISTPINPIGEVLTTSFANTIIDATDVKQQAEGALRSNASLISAATGLPVSEVNAMIDDLGIQDWEVITLPNDAVVSNTYSFSHSGSSYKLITYMDPSYITIEKGNVSATFAIPENGQGYVKYLQYMK